MRAKVLRTYRDKETNEVQRKGKTITLTKKRFQEINGTSFGIFLEEIKEEKKEDKKK